VTEHAFSVDGNWEFLLLSMACGLLVGMAELIGRYRDEPYRAVRNPFGLVYVATNAGLSAIAYFLLIYYRGDIFSNLSDDKFLTAIVAGFGAMVIMRSKLFSFKTEGGETYAIGPDAVLSTILSSVDRQVDRARANGRIETVMKNLPATTAETAPRAMQFLRTTTLAAYQNLSPSEKDALDDVITDLENQPDLSSSLKLMAICFAILNISGEKNFKALMKDLSTHLSTPA
jgi:hypothetical protein